MGGNTFKDAALGALDAARSGRLTGTVVETVSEFLELGIDGIRGYFPGAAHIAQQAARETSTREEAIQKVIQSHVVAGGIGGFATGLGGFVSIWVGLPLNLVEFYLQAARMVAAIADLRGYDINDPEIREGIFLTLSSAGTGSVLEQAGGATPGGPISDIIANRLPTTIVMIVNKGISYRLVRNFGRKSLTRLGRYIPIAGSLIDAGLDAYMMYRIGSHARKEFPSRGESNPG